MPTYSSLGLLARPIIVGMIQVGLNWRRQAHMLGAIDRLSYREMELSEIIQSVHF